MSDTIEYELCSLLQLIFWYNQITKLSWDVTPYNACMFAMWSLVDGNKLGLIKMNPSPTLIQDRMILRDILSRVIMF